jgi:hypothetical protein
LIDQSTNVQPTEAVLVEQIILDIIMYQANHETMHVECCHQQTD